MSRVRLVMALVVLLGLTWVVPSSSAGTTAGTTAVPDPTRAGPRQSTLIEYDAGPTVVAVAPSNGIPIPVQLHGEIALPSGRGPFPVILLLHGRHSTCAVVGAESLGSPCPNTPVTQNVPSYRGYRLLASTLASHGYLVISIDANGINTYDTGDRDSGAQARAELITKSLDLLASWHTTEGPEPVGKRLIGKVDLARLGLMGHSRGGEGVTRWLATSTAGPSPYRASAVFSLAPTDFADHLVRATPFAVLLPRCDGDVSDLQGADVFERSKYVSTAPLHQIVIDGANHNWFNTVWTGDDSRGTSDRVCKTTSSGSRLTARQQERLGLAWMAAFFRRYVGGERAFDAPLAGRTLVGCSTGTTLPCASLSRLTWLPEPGHRTTVLRPRTTSATDVHAETGTRLVLGPGLSVSGCDPMAGRSCPAQDTGATSVPSRSRGPQLTMTWNKPSYLDLLATGPWSVKRTSDLVLRAATNAEDGSTHQPGETFTRLRVRLRDTAGRTQTVTVTPRFGAPEPPPGSSIRNLLLSDTRLPLSLFRSVDLTHLVAIRIYVDDASGSLQLADVSFQRP